jgi:hypothetical protein
VIYGATRWAGLTLTIDPARRRRLLLTVKLCFQHLIGRGAVKKVDIKKELKPFYKTSAKDVIFVEVPQMNFLMVDGAGDPNTSADFSDAVEALFSLSYALKFMVKKGGMAIDYGVMPLEGLWWADNMSEFAGGSKDNWQWTAMIMQPEFITLALVTEATSQTEKKKNLPALPMVRFESWCEGKAAQTLHIGPFSEEGPTIARVHRFIEENGLERAGKHHEIYLSDIRRAAPDKWQTIIRQPVKK